MSRWISLCWIGAALALGALAACSTGSGSVEPALDEGDGTFVREPCRDDEEYCGGVCVDLATDPHHCGECRGVCGSGFDCVDGACSCAEGKTDCGRACADLDSNPNHCGECGQACGPGFACVNGECETEATCSDACPFPNGITWGCRQRFMYGSNLAWNQYAGDFGSVPAWGDPGTSANAAVSGDLEDLANHGVSVIRWWVIPDFRGAAVQFDDTGTPISWGGTLLADLERALELADEHDLYLMLCLFSFDAFRTNTADGLPVAYPHLRPIATDPDRRAALLENVVRPLARTAEGSPHRDHLIAWDVINEPEGAMTGASMYGDPDFREWNGLDPMTHEEMESFLLDVISVLREESSALVTVGSVATIWSRAWINLGLDFYQFHIYDWIDEQISFSSSPQELGIDDKPVVMGEFPNTGLDSANYTTLLESWYGNGYAGALSWSYTDFDWESARVDIRGFAEAHACETSY